MLSHVQICPTWPEIGRFYDGVSGVTQPTAHPDRAAKLSSLPCFVSAWAQEEADRLTPRRAAPLGSPDDAVEAAKTRREVRNAAEPNDQAECRPVSLSGCREGVE